MFKKTVIMFSVAAVIILCFSLAAQLASVEAAPPKMAPAEALVSDGNAPCEPQPCCCNLDGSYPACPVANNCGGSCTECTGGLVFCGPSGTCEGDL